MNTSKSINSINSSKLQENFLKHIRSYVINGYIFIKNENINNLFRSYHNR